MYAIIRDGGHQYRVAPGDRIKVELRAEAKPGEAIEFADVLLLRKDSGTTVGTPAVKGAKVTAEVLGLAKADKVTIFHFRKRKASRKKTGHRQKYTEVAIKEIVG
ncbi:MAG: 50S ribosomal protein L21 [Planctomycetes bacterium]|nr:50S ribosomal protein L21 [Planctomycetota bacterium]MBI3845054.1 50S ribosomal protein L21 [Planctomycetota bacterium]